MRLISGRGPLRGMIDSTEDRDEPKNKERMLAELHEARPCCSMLELIEILAEEVFHLRVPTTLARNRLETISWLEFFGYV